MRWGLSLLFEAEPSIEAHLKARGSVEHAVDGLPDQRRMPHMGTYY